MILQEYELSLRRDRTRDRCQASRGEVSAASGEENVISPLSRP